MSVVIPTRDRWERLSRTLACAQEQEGVRVEVVVVDDGSTDGTAQKLGRLGDTRVVVLRREHSIGVAKARNAGIRRACGEWVAFLDDDDLWSPRKLFRQLSAAREAKARWCYSAAAILDSRGRPQQIGDPPSPDSVRLRLRGVNAIPAGASNVIVRADLLDSVGPFDEELRHFADWDLWIRLAAAARPATVAEPLVAYVQHSANLRLSEPEVLMGELDRLDAMLGLAGDIEPGRFGILRWIGEAEWRSGHRGAAIRTFARLLRSHRTVAEIAWLARTVRPHAGILARSRSRSRHRDAGRGRIDWLERHTGTTAFPSAVDARPATTGATAGADPPWRPRRNGQEP